MASPLPSRQSSQHSESGPLVLPPIVSMSNSSVGSGGGGRQAALPVSSGAGSSTSVIATVNSDTSVVARHTSNAQSPRTHGKSQSDRKPPGLDAVPHELLATLTRHRRPPVGTTTVTTAVGGGGSGAVIKARKQPGSTTSKTGRPDAAWNFASQRSRFKHLTDNPVCFCGSGKDVSFLYDAQLAGKMDVSKTGKALLPLNQCPAPKPALKARQDSVPSQEMSTPTLIPNEFHICQSSGVLGLDIQPSEHTTKAVEHTHHQVAFPSLHPASRQQVLALKETMEAMFKKAKLDEAGMALQGKTQLHNLVELIRKEQDLYNICFHEVIRQVSVECVERGQVLADIRDRYNKILGKVPEQVLSLHNELMAQRSLDRQLACELQRFQSQVAELSDQLEIVHNKDDIVQQETSDIKAELADALAESHKNTNLLREYHELYELQRRRLEYQQDKLLDEKDLWQKAAYSLALKVTDEQCLQTSRRLQLCERCWYKLALRFAVLLSDSDITMISMVRDRVQTWKSKASKVCRNLENQDSISLRQMAELQNGMRRWERRIKSSVMNEDGTIKPPKDTFCRDLYVDIKKWEKGIIGLAEQFGGQTVLDGEASLDELRQCMTGLSDFAVRLYNRHCPLDVQVHPDKESMQKMLNEVTAFHKKISIRLSGENGVADGLIKLVSPLEHWSNKINVVASTDKKLPDSDWLKLHSLLMDWQQKLRMVIGRVGKTTPMSEEEAVEAMVEKLARPMVSREDLMDSNVLGKVLDNWLGTSMNGIEMENGRIVQQISDTHSSLIHWVVSVLLVLTRTEEEKEDLKRERREQSILQAVEVFAVEEGQQGFDDEKAEEEANNKTVASLNVKCQMLSEQMQNFTSILFKCCSDVIQARFSANTEFKDIDDDEDYKDLKRLQSEAEDFAESAGMLLKEVDAVLMGLAPSSAVTSAADIAAKPKQLLDVKKIISPTGSAADLSPGGTASRQRTPIPSVRVSPDTTPAPGTAADTTASLPGVDTPAVSGTGDGGGTSAAPEQRTAAPAKQPAGQLPEAGDVPINVIGVDDNVHPRLLDRIIPPTELPQEPDLTALQADAALPPSNFGIESEAFSSAVEEMRSKVRSLEARCKAADEKALTAEQQVADLTKKLEELRNTKSPSSQQQQRRSTSRRR